jgi:hypothetical protein
VETTASTNNVAGNDSVFCDDAVPFEVKVELKDKYDR